MALNLTLAVPGERYNADQVTWPMGMQLYLPKKWGGDDDSVYDSDEQRERYARLRRRRAYLTRSGTDPNTPLLLT